MVSLSEGWWIRKCRGNLGSRWGAFQEADAVSERGVGGPGALEAGVSDALDVGQQRVVEGMRGRPRDRTGEVRHRIMQHLIGEVSRIPVRGWPAGGDAAALINRLVDDHAAWLHRPDLGGAD